MQQINNWFESPEQLVEARLLGRLRLKEVTLMDGMITSGGGGVRGQLGMRASGSPAMGEGELPCGWGRNLQGELGIDRWERVTTHSHGTLRVLVIIRHCP